MGDAKHAVEMDSVTGVSKIESNTISASLGLLPQVMAFYAFQIYFTVRYILYPLGGSQNIGALPGDPVFAPKKQSL